MHATIPSIRPPLHPRLAAFARAFTLALDTASYTALLAFPLGLALYTALVAFPLGLALYVHGLGGLLGVPLLLRHAGRVRLVVLPAQQRVKDAVHRPDPAP